MAKQLAALDNDIQEVRAQIEQLRQRQSLISASLLSSRRTKSILQASRKSRQKNENISRQSAIDVVDKAADIVKSSTMRATTGMTAFRVKDPDPNAINDGNILGIRLDVLSILKREYTTPYFLFFQQISTGRLKLHQHTIPAFLPLRPLLRRYSLADSVDDNDGHKDQNLVAFVRAVRKQLVEMVRRTDAIETLKSKALLLPEAGQYRIKKVNATDPSAQELGLQLHNGAIVRIRLSHSPTVAKCSVRSDDLASKRLIERAISNHVGCVDGLANVLQQLKT